MIALKPGRDIRTALLYLAIALAVVQALRYALSPDGARDVGFFAHHPGPASRLLLNDALETSVSDAFLGIATLVHPVVGVVGAFLLDVGMRGSQRDYNPITGVSTDVPVEHEGLMAVVSLGAALLSVLMGYAVADRATRGAPLAGGPFRRAGWLLAAFPLGALVAALVGTAFPSLFGALALCTALRTVYVERPPRGERPTVQPGDTAMPPA